MQTLASVHRNAADVGNGALMKLTASLVERLEKFPAGNIPEPLAMEYATGMLLAENAFENYTALSAEFPKQVEAMLARLDAAQASRPMTGAEAAPLLDEMSRRAQERLLLAQVCREIQANLRHMEQVLDGFFRDHARRAELASLAKDSQQIRGALQMLDLDEADQLLALCQEQIAAYADADAPVSDDDLELLAESLSGLGFYIEAVEQQRPDRERLIAPFLAKRRGEAAADVGAAAADSAEQAVAELRNALPTLVEEVRRAPASADARDALKSKLSELRNDAELIGDPELVARASSALAELQAGGTATLAAAVTAMAEAGTPAPEISAETQRLLATDATSLDAELVEIYLAEAAEVLDNIDEHLRLIEANPGDREALRTIRRGFHTLKGSGRMVGLMDLGEIAYDVEKIHNRLLEEERPVTRAVLQMITVAERDFRHWVATLSATGKVIVDPAALHAAIRAVEYELPGGRESVLKSTVTAATPVAAEAPQTAAPTPLGEPAPLESAAPQPPPQPFEEIAAVETAEVLPSIVDELPLSGSEPAPPEPSFELPELGSAIETAEATPAIEFSDAVDDEGLELPPVEARSAVEDTPPAPVAAPVAVDEPAVDEPTVDQATVAAAPAEPVLADASEADELTIGGVTLSATLFGILMDEADEHLATLKHGLSVMQFDPHQTPSPEMVRAGHTLCGIHRTGGFPLLAELAKALEQCLLALQLREPPLSPTVQPVLARAIGGLDALVARIKSRAAFTSDDSAEAGAVVQELDLLRQSHSSEVTDAEAYAAQMAARDERVAPVPGEAALVQGEMPAAAEPAVVDAGIPAVDHVPMAVADVAAAVEPAVAALETSQPEVIPEAVPPGVPVDPLADVADDVDPQVLPIFLEEAAELFPRAGDALRAWARDPELTHHASELRRTLHTFKGSARMAGAMRLGQLTHLMESRLLVGDVLAAGTPALFEALHNDLDNVAFVFDALREGRVNVELPWVAAAVAGAAEAAESIAVPPPVAEPSPEPIVPAPVPAAAEPPLPAAPAMAAVEPPVEAEAGQRALLRVRADIIDRLANEAGEVSIARARVEGELRSLKANLLELTNSVIRLRREVRELEIQGESQIQSHMSPTGEAAEGFDPLEFDRYTRFQELTRSLAEGVNDVSTVQQSLLRNLDDADAALVAQGRLSRDVQQQLFAIRTVPFGSLSDRLYRILRQLAKELDKRANLEIRGAQVELDRAVLEKLVGPMEHLLRNALDHGIEPPDTRAAAGKPEAGEISLTVRQVGNEIAIELADDGRGLDLAEIRAKAVAQHRLAADAQPTTGQLIECIFAAGFSTAAQVTQVSGRGIGMDVVRSEIAALGGRIEVTTSVGQGTTFLIYLPLTLAVAQAVLVRAGGRLWALPAPMVEQVQHLTSEHLLERYVAGKLEWQGVAYPFHYLPRLLGDNQHRPETRRHNSVLLLRSGPSIAAVHVDEMVGNQEIVVKNIGPQLARVSGIAGATVLGSGEIVLIINPVQLAQRVSVATFDDAAQERLVPGLASGAMAVAGPPLVMVVDDSLTVRKITSRLLNREGFKVSTAKDGVDALEALAGEIPDVILLDIEMPRMDGFEFTRNLKSDPRLAHIPIIMITSRTAEKHRARARELGVDLYLGKPYQEEELVRNLREMLSLAT
jgi:chemosensory pili system protein ChpA (sensor histidine kinase/response regulator)